MVSIPYGKGKAIGDLEFHEPMPYQFPMGKVKLGGLKMEMTTESINSLWER